MNVLLGERLQAARKNAGLTQNQVAQITGISRGKLIAIEKGETDIEFSLISKLAHLYGYSMNYFIEEEGSGPEEFNYAFRTVELDPADMFITAWGRRILLNIRDLQEISREAGL